MPEITIALFPDVGGSYFLNRTPGMIGRFLSLTSAHINAADALFANLGDVFLAHEQRHVFIAALSMVPLAIEVVNLFKVKWYKSMRVQIRYSGQ